MKLDWKIFGFALQNWSSFSKKILQIKQLIHIKDNFVKLEKEFLRSNSILMSKKGKEENLSRARRKLKPHFLCVGILAHYRSDGRNRDSALRRRWCDTAIIIIKSCQVNTITPENQTIVYQHLANLVEG